MFQRFEISKMSSKMAEIAGCVLWNHMGFLLYTALKKITDLFFHNGNVFLCVIVMVMCFCLCHCSGNRIHQSMHYFQDYFWLDLIIRTLISYYSYKSSYSGQTFCQEIMK